MKSLSTEDRTFFGLVNEAAFANPFGKERHAVDLRLAESSPDTDREKVLEDMIQRVWKRMSRLGPIRLDEWDSADRDKLEATIVFSEFHRYSPQMDAHIQEQLKTDKPMKAEFGKEIVTQLVEYGLSEDRALRAAGIFYQLRRAFHFIDTSLVGTTESMRRVREQMWNNVFTHDVRSYESKLWDRMEDFSTFIVGETGTGKGTAAAAIGRSGWIGFDASSARYEQSFTKAFVSVNMSEFSEGLIESELFGHRKGAFTGAIDTHVGVFKRCEPHGTIFLDEIGELPGHIQIKLLRVLQERVFLPVGSHEALRFSGRVVAATNRPVDELRRLGRFRDDFYYRLCSDVIVMPTLREQILESDEVLPDLVSHIATRILGHRHEGTESAVLRQIRQELPEHYPWPGNVRELEQCVRRVILTGSYKGDFSPDHVPGSVAELSEHIDAESIDARELVAQYCRMLYARHGTYEEVSRITELDRRTVKKHIVGQDDG